MKSLICLIAFVFCFLISKAQYPITQNLGSPSTLVKNPNYGGTQGGLIPFVFTDTSSANSLAPYLKMYDGAIIKTLTPIEALWWRDLSASTWIQILPSGGSTGAIAWLSGGNSLLLLDAFNNSKLGTNVNAGIYLTTNNTTRLLLDKAGIAAETGTTVGLGYDPSNGNIITQFSGSGSTPTWQQTLTAGSTLNQPNTIDGGNNTFTFDNADNFYVNSNSEMVLHNSVAGITSGLEAASGYASINAATTIHNISTIQVRPDSINLMPDSGRLIIDTLNNLSTQDELLGRRHSTGQVGYITLGSGLSINSGVLNFTGTGGIGNFEDSIANVRYYGAVGDGVTEDSAAFKAAIATGKTVYVPKGIYLNNTVGGLQLNVGQTIFGDGGKQSEIITTTNGTDAYASMYSIIITNTRSEIRGLYFKGTGYGTFSGTYSTQNGIQIMDESSLITGCYFSHLRGAGVLGMYYNGSSFAAKDWNLISDCHFDSCAIGIYNYQSNNYTNMADNMIYRCNYGILNNVSNATVNGGVIELCDYGFYSYEGDRGTVSNVHINHSNTYNVYIYGTTNGYNISNCTFFYGSLYLSNADRTVFDNCGLATNGNITVTGTGTPQVVSFNNGYYANTNNWIISGTGKVIKTGLIDAGVANYNIVADSIKNTGKVSIIDGTQGAGKVFVSDANGVGTWTTSAAPSLTSTYVGYGIGGVLSGSSKLTFDNADLLTLTGGTNGLITVDNPGSGVSRLKLSNQSGYYAIQDLSTGGDYYILQEGYGTERIRITHSNGYVGINNATPGAQLDVTGTLWASGAVKMSNYTAGAATFDGSGNITSVSDRRAKHNIMPFTYGLSDVVKINPSTFIYNQDSSNTVMSGFIAQDIQKVIPIAVHQSKQKNGMMSLETNAILAASINAIKELKILNDEQQKQINYLKKEVKKLKNKK